MPVNLDLQCSCAADYDDVIVMNIIKIKISRHTSVPLILPDHPKIASASLVHSNICVNIDCVTANRLQV